MNKVIKSKKQIEFMRDLKKPIKYLPFVVLLLLAATLVLTVVLIPIIIASLGQAVIPVMALGLIIVITTVASLVALMIYITLTGR